VPPTGVRLVQMRIRTPSGLFGTPIAVCQVIAATMSLVVRFRGRHRPDAIFSTGGFVSLPGTLAGWLRRVPVVVFLPDAKPGKAVRLAVRCARIVCLSTSDAAKYLPSTRTKVTGYPVRRAFLTPKNEEANLRPTDHADERQILVMGGSLGSRSINDALMAGLTQLLPEVRVLHICGARHLQDLEVFRGNLPQGLVERYEIRSFLDERELAAAMRGSTLAVTRAGASILGELTVTRLPAIIIPLPAVHVHQQANADVLHRRGACVLMADQDLSGGGLVTGILELLANGDRLQLMRSRLAELARPEAADLLADTVLEAAASA